MSDWYRALYVNLTARAPKPRRAIGGDRGEINASVAWTGAMVLLAVTIAGIVTARATGFADTIDFGSP